jgi:hypothetical protein
MTFLSSKRDGLGVQRRDSECAQARDLVTHPVLEQLRQHLFEQHRAATKATRNCRICCLRTVLG